MAISKQMVLKGAKTFNKFKKEGEEAPVNENSVSRKEEASFSTAFVSKNGMEDTNNNYFAFVEGESFACWAMADGHKGSGKLAKVVVEEVLKTFLTEPSFDGKFFKKAYKNILKKLKENEEYKDQITSLAIVLSDYHSCLVAYAGNTRIYHLTNGLINYKTKDHSVAQLMFEADKMGEKDVRYHYRKNDLTKAVGKGKLHIEKVPMPLQSGDGILLSTIGAWENMEEREVEVEFSKAHSTNEWIVNLEKRIIASGNKKINNYTLGGILVEDTAEPLGKEKKKINYKLIGAIVVLVLVIGVLGVNLSVKAKWKNDIYAKASQHEQLANENLKEGRYSESIEYLRKANGEYQKLISQKVSKNKLYRSISGQELMIESTKKQMTTLYEKTEKVDKLLKASLKEEEAEKLANENKFEEALKIYEDVQIVYNNQNFGEEDEIINNLTKSLNEKVVVIRELKGGMDFKLEGDKAYEEGDYQKATSRYEDAKIVFVKYGKQDLVAGINIAIENSGTVRGDLMENARIHENKGYELEYEYPLNAIDHFEKAMEAYRQLKRDSNIDSINERILKVKTRMQEEVNKGNELYQNALKYVSQERFSDSLEAFERAKNIYVKNGDFTKGKKVDTEVSNVKRMMAKKADIQEAFDIEKLASEKYIEKEYDEAKNLYLQASSLFKSNKFSNKVEEIKRKIHEIDGNIYEAKGDLAYLDFQLKGAISNFELAKKKYEDFGDKELINRINQKLNGVINEDNWESAIAFEKEGDSLYKEKKYEDALNKYNDAKKHYESIKDFDAIKNSYENIIKILDKKIRKSENKLKDTSWLPW